MLYIIGLGLSDPNDITLKGFDAIKKSDYIYLESYTSKLNCNLKDLEKLYEKKIIISDRSFVEQSEDILKNSKKGNVALLIIGDVFSATTHFDIYREALDSGVEVEVINNASILTAVSVTGLQLYKFGRTASIPFHNENVETPYNILKDNISIGLHTLFLLDLKPGEKYMTVSEALKYLLRVESEKKKKLISEKTLCVGCARLGSKNFKIKTGKIKDLLKEDFGEPLYSLIIPGKMHFLEEEALEIWD